MICLRLYSVRVYNNFSKARDNWMNIADKNCIKIMINYAKIGKKLYYIQMPIACFVIIQYILFPVLQPRENVSNLPVRTICTFNNLGTTRHILVYFIESVGAFYVVFSYFGIDAVFFGIAMHLCGQVKILQKQFNKIARPAGQSTFIRKLSVLTQKYYALTQLTRDINITYSFIIYLQFILTTFLFTSRGMYQVLLFYVFLLQNFVNLILHRQYFRCDASVIFESEQ